VPLYNFGVSQHFKTWVDMVITTRAWPQVPSPSWPASPPSW
jgi:hypothetical protein